MNLDNEELKATKENQEKYTITRPYKTPLEVYITDIKMLLHLIEKQSKVIDEMAEYTKDYDINVFTGEYIWKDTKEIKQYFYRKAEEV